MIDVVKHVSEGQWRATVRVQRLGPGAKTTEVGMRGTSLSFYQRWQAAISRRYKFNIDGGSLQVADHA